MAIYICCLISKGQNSTWNRWRVRRRSIIILLSAYLHIGCKSKALLAACRVITTQFRNIALSACRREVVPRNDQGKQEDVLPEGISVPVHFFHNRNGLGIAGHLLEIVILQQLHYGLKAVEI